MQKPQIVARPFGAQKVLRLTPNAKFANGGNHFARFSAKVLDFLPI
jgi:hypothetical protein